MHFRSSLSSYTVLLPSTQVFTIEEIRDNLTSPVGNRASNSSRLSLQAGGQPTAETAAARATSSPSVGVTTIGRRGIRRRRDEYEEDELLAPSVDYSQYSLDFIPSSVPTATAYESQQAARTHDDAQDVPDNEQHPLHPPLVQTAAPRPGPARHLPTATALRHGSELSTRDPPAERDRKRPRRTYEQPPDIGAQPLVCDGAQPPRSAHRALSGGVTRGDMRLTDSNDDNSDDSQPTTRMPPATGQLRTNHPDPNLVHDPIAASSSGNQMAAAAYAEDAFSGAAPIKNGHLKALSNGSTNGSTNGSGSPRAEGSSARHSNIPRVNPPGVLLYPDSETKRKEYVRLVLQSLKDIGYTETAATLEAESGFSYETSHVRAFRRLVLSGDWNAVEKSLETLDVRDGDNLRTAKFLISQQKYLEALETQRKFDAMVILQQEIAPVDIERDRLNHLSSLMMCSSIEELQLRASWDGASGNSRHVLLTQLQHFVPSSVMVPPRRLDELLGQARQYQSQQCRYHVSNLDSSLYHDHHCSRHQFPTTTTHILEGHTDEVWQIQWSHSGTTLASGSRDKTVILWSIPEARHPADRECSLERVLQGHNFHISALAWSPDDTKLLTSAEQEIRIWNVQTGTCIAELQEHKYAVNGLCWRTDGTGFVSGGMDCKVAFWDSRGQLISAWNTLSIRVIDLDITADVSKLVAIGLVHQPSAASDPSPSPSVQARLLEASAGVTPSPSTGASQSSRMERRIAVYDIESRQELWSSSVWGELTSLKVSDSLGLALINHQQGDVMLWDITSGRLVQRLLGRPPGSFVVRSAFGGPQDNFVLSGCEDGHVYIWHCPTGTLLEVLLGHQKKGVNSAVWCPTAVMFATCGDDGTVRIWEPEPATMFEEMLRDGVQVGSPVTIEPTHEVALSR